MSKRKTSDVGAVNAKEQKMDNDVESEQPNPVENVNAENVVAKSPNDESSPEIFKLNSDCFYEIFNHLLPNELNAFAQTCKAMQNQAGQFFGSQYKAVCAKYRNGTIYVHGDEYEMKLSGFAPFIRKIFFQSDGLEQFEYFNRRCKDSIKEIQFKDVKLNEAKIDLIKEILNKVEVIKLIVCQFDEDFYQGFLRFVPNLKHLSIEQEPSFLIDRSKGPIIGNNNRWLLEKYPNLEHFEWIGRDVLKIRIGELKTLFLNNSSIQHLSIDAKLFLRHRLWIMRSQIKLHDLTIIENDGLECGSERFLKILNKTYSRGFYKRLHFFSSCYDGDVYRRMVSFPALETLYLSGLFQGAGMFSGPGFRRLDLSPFVNVRELGLSFGAAPLDAHTIGALVNLERVYLKYARRGTILPFIRYSKTVKEIFSDNLENSLRNDDGVENYLLEFNNERRKLDGAQKLIIYGALPLYFVAKIMNHRTSLDLVEIKRADSYEWPCSLSLKLNM